MNYSISLKNKLSDVFNNKSNFLFSKGRVALYATLKAMNFGEGDEVILPSYTCLVVPTATKILGIQSKYVDIDSTTYNLDVSQLESQFTSKTNALIVQHTYGIPCNMDEIVAWASSKGIPIIEDCCLAFGSRYYGQLCGTFGIASYFSGQWNKPFSTGLGGMLVVNDQALADKVQKLIYEELIQPPLSHRLRIWLQMMLFNSLVTPTTVQTITRLYRSMSKMGIAVGSSTASEYDGVVPKNYFMGMTVSQAKKGVQEMNRIDENISHRKTITNYYEEELLKHGFQTVELNLKYDPVYVRYPIRVKNKADVLEAAYKEKVEIGSWFESPLHPAGTNLELFDYTPGSCPQAELASNEAINLPTHRKTSLKEAERVIDFLRKYAQPVL